MPAMTHDDELPDAMAAAPVGPQIPRGASAVGKAVAVESPILLTAGGAAVDAAEMGGTDTTSAAAGGWLIAVAGGIAAMALWRAALGAVSEETTIVSESRWVVHDLREQGGGRGDMNEL